MYFLCNRKRGTTSNNIKVATLIPLSKPNGALVQLVRIHACHAWGHGFESRTHRLMLFEKSSKRALSSAGSERLPYKQRVGGSNPSAPTSRQVQFALVFSFYLVSSFGRCSILSRFLCFREWFRSYAKLSFAFIEGNVW